MRSLLNGVGGGSDDQTQATLSDKQIAHYRDIIAKRTESILLAITENKSIPNVDW